ncbi:MAG TPA: hypothetical protein VG758_28790 [Hyphomicrobiaceae bacterium]|jgi:hypothetical protein|nr:hypothetical protein [Hyphomicrobiaceae bacterium]
MLGRTTRVWHITREEANCIEFDAELDAYMEGGHVVALLRAAHDVAGSAIEMDPKRAFAIAKLTGACDELLVDYDDAARAIRRWFAQTLEPGARH